MSYPKFGVQDFSSSILYQGKCSTSGNWARGLHLLINILGTIMLVASNYCMQCLCSPSRQDIEGAHAQRKWLNIGVSSIRNFRYVDRKRVVLWAVLLMSSLPVHLLSVFGIFRNQSLTIGQVQFYRFLRTGYTRIWRPPCIREL